MNELYGVIFVSLLIVLVFMGVKLQESNWQRSGIYISMWPIFIINCLFFILFLEG